MSDLPKDTNLGYARAILRSIAEAATRLPPHLRLPFVEKRCNRPIRTARHRYCSALADLSDSEAQLDRWMMKIGSVDRGSRALQSWLSTTGSFDQRYESFVDELQFGSAHQTIAARRKSGELQPVLEELSTRYRALDDAGEQLMHLTQVRKILKEHNRCRRGLVDVEKLLPKQIKLLVRALTYWFPGLDWRLDLSACDQ
jgi:hypothetical protein